MVDIISIRSILYTIFNIIDTKRDFLFRKKFVWGLVHPQRFTLEGWLRNTLNHFNLEDFSCRLRWRYALLIWHCQYNECHNVYLRVDFTPWNDLSTDKKTHVSLRFYIFSYLNYIEIGDWHFRYLPCESLFVVN